MIRLTLILFYSKIWPIEFWSFPVIHRNNFFLNSALAMLLVYISMWNAFLDSFVVILERNYEYNSLFTTRQMNLIITLPGMFCRNLILQAFRLIFWFLSQKGRVLLEWYIASCFPTHETGIICPPFVRTDLVIQKSAPFRLYCCQWYSEVVICYSC